jgi:hypothetical protein
MCLVSFLTANLNGPHANHRIKKSLKALLAIRLIEPHFHDIELKQLITSIFKSIRTTIQKIGTCPVSTLASAKDLNLFS